MDVLFDLVVGLGVIGGGYYWVKTKLLKADTPRDIEIFPSRGVPLVKRSREQQANSKAESAESAKVAAVEQVEQVEQVEPLSAPVHAISEPAIATLAVKTAQADIHSIPEDSVLKRHYLAQRAAERQAITNPYPSDSVLRRHHESALAASFAPTRPSAEAADVEPVDAAGPVAAIVSPPQPDTPQDSVLKRHYRQMLESKLAENSA